MADLSGRTLGEFLLREKIGEGGHGAVYRAEQPLLERDVVVKVLHERRHGRVARARFLREAQLASLLDHPYAAHVYAFGAKDDDGLLWIAMERVHGITLSDWLRARGPMPLEQLVPFFERVAQVVHAAHERGIIHRDLKPSNVMVLERGGLLFPKLLDFGIAKLTPEVAPPTPPRGPDGALAQPHEPVDAPGTGDVVTAPMRTHAAPVTPSPAPGRQLTRSGVAIGSRPYMSPEQWSNACAVGPASDLYSLGVVAYEALTGRVPFTGDSTGEYHRQHLHAAVPPLGGDFSPDLDRVIRRALDKYPEHRHDDALELASELRAALRASEREQLRASAQQWEDRARPPGLLWGPDLLADLERWTRRAPPAVLSELECSFVAASQRRARRIRWFRRSLIVLAVAIVLSWFLYRAAMQARMAEQRAASEIHAAQLVTEATATQSELEQGRSALLHGEPDAPLHLGRAYQRGDRSPSTAFMLARALQPRLAEQARFASTFGRMWSAAFSPDGKQLVTTDDRNAQVWDAQTYRRLFMLPHGDTVYQAVYSADGTMLATAGGDGAVRIWDAASGALVRELRRDGAEPRYVLVALSPDGKLIAAMNMEVAYVWNAHTGAPMAELRDDASSGSPSLAFSADGRWLAMSSGNDVHVFDTGTWKQILTISGPGIDGLSWDPNGPHLLTGSTQGDASIWAIPSGKRIHHLREIGEPVDAVAFSPNGELVVAASRDGAEQIWHATSGQLQSQGNHLRGKIRSIEFDPTSTLIVVAGTSGAVAVVDAGQGMLVSVLEGPRNVVMVAHFDRGSQRVVGASWDGTARIWKATSPYRKWSSPPASDDCGLVTSLEPDRRFLAIGCKDHPTRVWDTAHGQLLAELPSVTPAGGDFASAYPAVSATGDRAAIARGRTVEVYELPGGRLLRTILHGAPVNTVAFASTERHIVSGAVDGSLLVTHDNGATHALPKSPAGIDAAGVLPDGRVVAADAQRRLRVYDPGGVVLADFETTARIRTLRMSSDSRRLITVPSFTSKVAPPELWDLEHYRTIAQLGGQGLVYSARFVAGGQILTTCGDGTAGLWDGATGRLRQTYRGGSRFLADATLSSDGSMIVAGGGDGVLRFWEATSGRPLWTMPAHRSHLVGIRVEGFDIVTRGFSGEISRWTLPRPEQVIEACGDHESCAIMPK